MVYHSEARPVCFRHWNFVLRHSTFRGNYYKKCVGWTGNRLLRISMARYLPDITGRGNYGDRSRKLSVRIRTMPIMFFPIEPSVFLRSKKCGKTAGESVLFGSDGNIPRIPGLPVQPSRSELGLRASALRGQRTVVSLRIIIIFQSNEPLLLFFICPPVHPHRVSIV